MLKKIVKKMSKNFQKNVKKISSKCQKKFNKISKKFKKNSSKILPLLVWSGWATVPGGQPVWVRGGKERSGWPVQAGPTSALAFEDF